MMLARNIKFSMSVGILLGSFVLLLAYSDAAKIKKKGHDKRQISRPLLYRPSQSRLQYGRPLTRANFPAPRYQYNSAFRNVAPIRPNKQLQSAYAGSQYPKTFNAQAQRRYTSYYYPHQTHYRDWSRKLIEASAYARKLQDIKKQERLQKQKSNPSNAGIKLFVAGVNRNGNVQGHWIDQGKIQKPNGQRNQEFLRNKSWQQNLAAKIPNTVFVGPMQQSAPPVTGVNMNNGPPSGAPVALKPTNLQSQTQTNSLHDIGSTTKPNSNEAILSDNLGGAALGPNAHSLLQPTTPQQASQNSALGNVQGSQSEPKQSSVNPQPKANSVQSHASLNLGDSVNKGSPNDGNIPRQGQTKNVPSSNVQNLPINTGMNNLQANSAQKNTASHLPNARLTAVRGPASQTKANSKPLPGNGGNLSNTVTGESQISFSTPGMKSTQPPNAPTDSINIDKSTAQQLNAGLALTSASRPPSLTVETKSSTPNAVPYNNNSGSRNSVPGNVNRVQTQIDKELALKNLLFPPPAASRNQVYGTALNAVQKPQPQQLTQGQVNNMIPSFPAFRYDANLPATGQTVFNSYRRNSIPHPPSAAKNKKSFVPQHNPAPYKSSFPLMLHKISPYFKMKRNLKLVASEQAKARRRFLELQPIK
ncbi:hypothetical protein ACROYT_G006918 [Oculina patagonica]